MVMIAQVEKTVNASLGKRCVLARITRLSETNNKYVSKPFYLPLYFVYRTPERIVNKGDELCLQIESTVIEEIGSFDECRDYMKVNFIRDYEGKGKSFDDFL